MPLSVDAKEGPLVEKPVPGVAQKAWLTPQVVEEERVRCTRAHSIVLFTLQVVIPLMGTCLCNYKIYLPVGKCTIDNMFC